MPKRELKEGFRSKFEKHMWKEIIAKYPKAEYEKHTFEYTQPEKKRKYTPDFQIDLGSNIFIEAKGKLDIETRQKMIMLRDSRPDIVIIFLFMNPTVKIRKGSKTTYGMWAEKENFLWLDARGDWLTEYRRIVNEML